MTPTKSLLTVTLAASLGLFAAASGFAQAAKELTAEEMTEAFNKQKTRGLVLVPSGQQTEPQNDQANDSTQVAAAAQYQAVDKADQVNVQISFDFDSAALREDQKPKLDTLCNVMKSVDVAVFQIIGHTDSSGSAAYNENLSLLRAKEVKRHLVSSCGIAAERLEAIGLGESAPYNTDDPRSDENRRVEFQALG